MMYIVLECLAMLVEQEEAFSKENSQTFASWRSGVYWTCRVSSHYCYWTPETKKPGSINWIFSSAGNLFLVSANNSMPTAEALRFGDVHPPFPLIDNI